MRRARLATLSAVAAIAVLGAACAPTYGPGPYSPAGPAPFNAADFNWSAAPGRASIDGRVDFAQDGRVYRCTGSVALTPETPYTRARLQNLYGSSDRAALPEAVVRARTVPDASADYRGFVRSEQCDSAGRFRFANLPDGAWYVIAPVSAGGDDRFVLMRRVETRGGRAVTVTLN